MYQNELISDKHIKICTTLSHIEHIHIWVSVGTGCISVSAVASLLDIPIGITRSAIVSKFVQ